MRPVRGAALAAILLSVAAPALPSSFADPPAGDPADSAADGGEIIVVGDTGDGARLTADSLRDAARAYERNRDPLAPGATLYLFVLDEADGLRFTLRQRKADRDGLREVISLELDAGNRLVLPVDLVRTGEWELRVRGARSAARIRPLVLSPGSTLEDRRFGDMRLQCHVMVAFARLGPLARTLAGAIDPCDNRSLRLFARTDRPVATATIDNPAQELEIRPDGTAIRMPLADKAIGNEAWLRVTYR